MPASSFPPAPEGSPLPEGDRRALARFIEQNLDQGFRLAIVEAADRADRETILADVAAIVGPRLLPVDVAELLGADANLWMALQEPFETHAPRCLALWGFEDQPSSKWFQQLNIQRDLLVNDFPVPWLLFIHPASRVPLLSAAPDFCDFAPLWLRDERTPPPRMPAHLYMQESPLTSAEATTTDPRLQRAWAAIYGARFDEAQDALSQFDLQPNPSPHERIRRELYGARLELALGHSAAAEAALRGARSALARLPASTETDQLARLIDADIARAFMDSGHHHEAETLLREILPRFEQALGREHPDRVTVLHDLAQTLKVLGRYEEAEHLIQEVLSIQAETLGHEHRDYASSLNLLGSLLEHQGKYAEAEHVLRDALRYASEPLKLDALAYGALLHNLAGVLSAQGKYGEAERVLLESLASKERTLGREHPLYSGSLLNLADVLAHQGKLAEAERLLHHTLHVLEQTHGRRHLTYAACLHNLAVNLVSQGRQAEAELMLREVLSVVETAVGREHSHYAASLQALAGALAEQGKKHEAENLLRESLSLAEKALGPDHPQLCPMLSNLAMHAAPQGRTTEAIRLLERALKIGHTSLGPAHPEVLHMHKLLDHVKHLRRARRR